MSDVAAIRWESIATIGGVLALAVWALRDPASPAQQTADQGAAARFKILVARHSARVVELEDGATLGRSSDCTVTIDDTTVSKHHARLTLENGAWLEDLGSTNGTYVNGRRVEGSTVLRPGDRIALGAAKIVFLGLAPRGHLRPKG